MNRTPEAVALMNDVADHIEKYPHTYDQTVYDHLAHRLVISGHAVCGENRHCIAGWTCVLAGYKNSAELEVRGYRILGAELLGLSGDTPLFDGDWLPAKGMTVPEALRKLAGGADLEDVSYDGMRPYHDYE